MKGVQNGGTVRNAIWFRDVGNEEGAGEEIRYCRNEDDQIGEWSDKNG